MKTIGGIILGATLLISQDAFAGPKTGRLDDFEVGKYQYCGTDADCVKANNGCCDCANGGADVAVNKDRYKEFRDRFNCIDIMCTEMAAVPPCGSGVVSCLDHKCHYVSDKSFETGLK